MNVKYFQLDVHNVRYPNYEKHLSYTPEFFAVNKHKTAFLVELQTEMVVEHLLLYLECETCEDKSVAINYVTYRRSRDRVFQSAERKMTSGDGSVSDLMSHAPIFISDVFSGYIYQLE